MVPTTEAMNGAEILTSSKVSSPVANPSVQEGSLFSNDILSPCSKVTISVPITLFVVSDEPVGKSIWASGGLLVGS